MPLRALRMLFLLCCDSLLRHRNFRIFVFNNVRVILSSTVKIYSLESLENIRFVPSRSISHVERFDRDFRTRDNSVDRFLFIYPSFLELESKRKVLLDHRASSLSFSRNCILSILVSERNYRCGGETRESLVGSSRVAESWLNELQRSANYCPP